MIEYWFSFFSRLFIACFAPWAMDNIILNENVNAQSIEMYDCILVILHPTCCSISGPLKEKELEHHVGGCAVVSMLPPFSFFL